MSAIGYIVAFPECAQCAWAGVGCRLVLVAPGKVDSYGMWRYMRSGERGRAEVAVWRTRADATRAARAFLGASREKFSVRRVVRRGRT